jgi:LysM repeat protein
VRTTTAQPSVTRTTSTIITTTTTAGNGIATPNPIQPGIPSNCDAFHLIKSGDSCAAIASTYGITTAKLISWNAEIGPNCQSLWVDYYICVSIVGEEPASPSPTTTAPSNGVPTPDPVQPGIVNNCNAFHKIQSGDTCDKITALYGISRTQLNSWNAEIGSACQFIWVDYYICVGVIGTTPRPTTTSVGNGIATPTPIQPGMVNNCDAFYRVQSGDTCDKITAAHGISRAQLSSWNAEIGNACQFIWVDYYICVSIVGVDPSPTQPGNGIATPVPIQTGMTNNCRRFYFVRSGDTCASVARGAGISEATFYSWNTGVGSSCSALWLDTWYCIGV